MPLSWNEIKSRALKFAKDFADAHYERGETQQGPQNCRLFSQKQIAMGRCGNLGAHLCRNFL